MIFSLWRLGYGGNFHRRSLAIAVLAYGVGDEIVTA